MGCGTHRGRLAFWTVFAAYLVLLTPGKTPHGLAATRVGTTLFGVMLLAVASLILPNEVLFSFGAVILFSAIGLSPAYPVIGGGFTIIGSVLMAGAPTGARQPLRVHEQLNRSVDGADSASGLLRLNS